MYTIYMTEYLSKVQFIQIHETLQSLRLKTYTGSLKDKLSMNRILTQNYYACLFLVLLCLERNYVNGSNSNRNFLSSQTNNKSANVITSSHNTNGNLLIFNNPIILNIQNVNEIKTETIANLKESTVEKISMIKALLCSLFRVCDFEFFQMYDYILNIMKYLC